MEVLEEDRLAFAEELEEVALQLSMLDPSQEPATHLEQVSAEYERLSMAADMFALPEISELTSWASNSLQSEQAANLLMAGKYFSWIELTALTFREPEEISHLPLLIAELNDPLWPTPLPPEQLQSLLLSLRPPETAEPDEAEEAAENDNPLSFDPDIHPELLDAYMEETPGQVQETARLIRLIAIGADNAEQRKLAARLAHTVKGASSVVGVDPITSFTHSLEGLLEFPLQEIPRPLSETLEAAADCLESMFDNLCNQSGLPDTYETLDQQLKEWVERLGDEAETEQSDTDKVLPDLQALTELPDFLQSDDGDDVDEPNVPVDTRSGQLAVHLGEDRVQEMLGLTGELITLTSQTSDQLQQARNLGVQLYQQDEQIRQRLDELEVLVDQQRRKSESSRPSSDLAMSGAGDANKLKNLEIESYSDLYSTANLLTEAAADSRELAHELQSKIRRLSDDLYQQQRVQRQLSEAVLSLRLAPVSDLVPRMERIIRETCRKTGKQATISISGDDLQVDTDILKGLTDPLLHLLRNAVDHGIEMPAERVAQQKPEAGNINLNFTQSGNHVTLVLEDDGAGMNPERIRERAIHRGLIDAQQDISEEAILRLVLLPGFSTRDEVSEVSGRGVGMDVVQSAVEALRGTLRLSSEAGKGTRITMTLPQTLIATHALIVKAGGNLLAIPADSVEQLLYVPVAEQYRDLEGNWSIKTERYELPVMRLADILHWNSAAVPEEQAHTLLIVRSETETYALYVEEILPSRDVVISSLAPWLNYIHSVQGACILANGAVAPVLDMLRLLHELESGSLQLRAGDDADELVETETVFAVLVVDDSLSNRKSMRLMLEGMGYVVHTAVDGMDGLKLMNTVPVDLVLTDLEMPRMNGLEMTQAIRIWPEKKYLPIVMITSRSTAKHRKLADEAGVDGYLTKPVQTSLLEQEIRKWLGTQLATHLEKDLAERNVVPNTLDRK